MLALQIKVVGHRSGINAKNIFGHHCWLPLTLFEVKVKVAKGTYHQILSKVEPLPVKGIGLCVCNHGMYACNFTGRQRSAFKFICLYICHSRMKERCFRAVQNGTKSQNPSTVHTMDTC